MCLCVVCARVKSNPLTIRLVYREKCNRLRVYFGDAVSYYYVKQQHVEVMIAKYHLVKKYHWSTELGDAIYTRQITL